MTNMLENAQTMSNEVHVKPTDVPDMEYGTAGFRAR